MHCNSKGLADGQIERENSHETLKVFFDLGRVCAPLHRTTAAGAVSAFLRVWSAIRKRAPGTSFGSASILRATFGWKGRGWPRPLLRLERLREPGFQEFTQLGRGLEL